MKFLNSFCKLFLLLLLLGCSQTGSRNLSKEKQARPVEISVFSSLTELKKHNNETIRVNADFDKIDFDVQPPDELRAYRLTHFFVRLIQPVSDRLFILVPTSNTKINSLGHQDGVKLEGTVRIKDDNVCFFVTDIKKNPFTKK